MAKRVFKKLSNVEHVRLRPGMWLGQNSSSEYEQHFFEKEVDGSYRIYHTEVEDIPAKLKCLDEVCMNAVDEYNRNKIDKSLKPKERMKNLWVTLSADRKKVVVEDDGRGIPAQNAEQVFLHLMYGENFDDISKGERIAGQNGVGISLVRIVSKYFQASTTNAGWCFTKTFTLKEDIISKIKNFGLSPNEIKKAILSFDEHGNFDEIKFLPPELKRKIKKLIQKSEYATKVTGGNKNSASQHGTKVIFELDEKYFNGLEVSFKKKTLVQYLQDLAMTNPGLRVQLHHNGENKEFFFKNGLVDIFNSNKNGINNKTQVDTVFYKLFYHNKKNQFELEAIVKAGEGKSLTWVNANFVSLGGSSIEYFHNRLYDEIRKKPTLLNFEKKMKYTITRNDVRSTFHLYNNFHLVAPRFKSQDKSYLINDLKEEIRIIVEMHLDKIIYKLNLINKIKEVVIKKVSIREMEGVNKEMKKTNLSLIPKFIPATSRSNAEDKTLFIGEGDSAIAGLRPVRDPRLHALFPLKGKPLNVKGTTITKAMQNEEYKNIVSILGLPFQKEDLDINQLNFKRVVIITDADFDGYAIRSLLLSFFYEYWPKIFSYGVIYIAEAPLYEVELENSNKERKIFYSLNDEEFSSLMKKAESSGSRLIRKKRNKGLGETSKEAMSFAINNCLVKISLQNDQQATFMQNLWFDKTMASERRKAISKFKQLYLEE